MYWLAMVIMVSREQLFCYTVVMVRHDRNDQRLAQSPPGGGPVPGSYHTRVSEYGDTSRAAGDAALAAYAELYGRVERKLFADVAAGRSPASLKSVYLQRYGIPARMFTGLLLTNHSRYEAIGAPGGA